MTLAGQPTVLAEARRADSSRRRQRVLRALNDAAAGQAISVLGIAHAAGVHRTFLYRHPDLHAAVLAQAAQPPVTAAGTPGVSRESLLADLVNLQARNERMAQTIAALERRLSDALGEATWKASGLGAPIDMEALHQRIREPEQDNATLREQLEEREEELEAARASNRHLMTRLNSRDS